MKWAGGRTIVWLCTPGQVLLVMCTLGRLSANPPLYQAAVVESKLLLLKVSGHRGKVPHNEVQYSQFYWLDLYNCAAKTFPVFLMSILSTVPTERKTQYHNPHNYELNCAPQPYVEVLTPKTPKYDCLEKWPLKR